MRGITDTEQQGNRILRMISADRADAVQQAADARTAFMGRIGRARAMAVAASGLPAEVLGVDEQPLAAMLDIAGDGHGSGLFIAGA